MCIITIVKVNLVGLEWHVCAYAYQALIVKAMHDVFPLDFLVKRIVDRCYGAFEPTSVAHGKGYTLAASETTMSIGDYFEGASSPIPDVRMVGKRRRLQNIFLGSCSLHQSVAVCSAVLIANKQGRTSVTLSNGSLW